MKHVVCFSGGHSSSLVAVEVVRKYGKENVELVNHWCKLEPEDVARFENEVANYLGLPIIYANFEGAEVLDQFDVVIKKKAFINTKSKAREALCTHVMKTEPFMQYLELNHKPDECIVYYGFDAAEEDRITRRSSIMGVQGWRTGYPMIWEERTIHHISEIGIEPPNSYGIFKHANCIGCLKAGWQHWYCVYVLYPDIWTKGKIAEEVIGYSIHKDRYLDEREEEFAKMVLCGIEPTEKVEPRGWWVNAKKIVKAYDNTIIEIEEEEMKPCICFDSNTGL